jgi:hypothetical protein
MNDDAGVMGELDGRPVLSPALARWMPWLAFASVFPALAFLMVNVIEWSAGNDGGAGVFGSSLEGRTGLVNGVVGAGPFVALALVLASALRVHDDQPDAGSHTRVRLRWSPRLALLAVVAVLLATGVAVYLLTTNGLVTLPDSWDIW